MECSRRRGVTRQSAASPACSGDTGTFVCPASIALMPSNAVSTLSSQVKLPVSLRVSMGSNTTWNSRPLILESLVATKPSPVNAPSKVGMSSVKVSK